LALLVEVRLEVRLRRSDRGILHAHPVFAIKPSPRDGFHVVVSA
jgi:hypothetical protein